MRNYSPLTSFKYLDYFTALYHKIDVLNKRVLAKESIIKKAMLSLFSILSLVTLAGIMYAAPISNIFFNLVVSFFMNLVPMCFIGGFSLFFYSLISHSATSREKNELKNIEKQFAFELQNNPEILNDIVKLVKDEKAQEIFIKLVDKVRKKETEDVFSLYTELLVNDRILIKMNKEENDRADFLNKENIDFKFAKKEFELNANIKEKYLL